MSASSVSNPTPNILGAIDDRVDLIHPIVEQAWGQRVFRFHDPDGHAVEIGEPIAANR